MDLLYTDYHALLRQLPVLSINPTYRKIHQCKKVQKPKWQENKKSDCNLNINDSKFGEIMTYLEYSHQNVTCKTKEILNKICISISDTFTESANKIFKSTNNFTTHDESTTIKVWLAVPKYTQKVTFGT